MTETRSTGLTNLSRETRLLIGCDAIFHVAEVGRDRIVFVSDRTVVVRGVGSGMPADDHLTVTVDGAKSIIHKSSLASFLVSELPV